MERTLIYPGAGWDKEFLPYFKQRGYTKFILLDSMPLMKHYEPNMNGFKGQERFFHELEDAYGSFENRGSYLYFRKHNIYYYYSTNAHHFFPPNHADILIKGYFCESWKKYIDNRLIFVSCDTCMDELEKHQYFHCCLHDDEDFCGLKYNYDSDEEYTSP